MYYFSNSTQTCRCKLSNTVNPNRQTTSFTSPHKVPKQIYVNYLPPQNYQTFLEQPLSSLRKGNSKPKSTSNLDTNSNQPFPISMNTIAITVQNIRFVPLVSFQFNQYTNANLPISNPYPFQAATPNLIPDKLQNTFCTPLFSG